MQCNSGEDVRCQEEMEEAVEDFLTRVVPPAPQEDELVPVKGKRGNNISNRMNAHQ